jgi:uncharacterized membrane protein
MLLLVLGLVLFLGVHSTRVFADGWRTATVAKVGERPFKGMYSLVSIAGFALLVWGYGVARQNPVVLWPAPPVGMRHVAALLTMIAFVLLAAAYVPGNEIKHLVHHPMILGVKVWALAHLLANNTLADVLLFGAFLVWAVLDFRAARKRDRDTNTVYVKGTMPRTAVTVIVGVAAWAVFAFWLHRAWIGVQPLGVGA